jgi:hypothetical protein
MPCAARLGPRCSGALVVSSAELLAPASDRFVRDHDTTLEQQLLDAAQAQAEPEIPANRATDEDGREAVTAIKRFRFRDFVFFIISFYRRLPINLTEPPGAMFPDFGWPECGIACRRLEIKPPSARPAAR